MYPTPSSAWYASGIRWIASGLMSFADVIERHDPDSGPPGPSGGLDAADEYLMDARHRAHRGL